MMDLTIQTMTEAYFFEEVRKSVSNYLELEEEALDKAIDDFAAHKLGTNVSDIYDHIIKMLEISPSELIEDFLLPIKMLQLAVEDGSKVFIEYQQRELRKIMEIFNNDSDDAQIIIYNFFNEHYQKSLQAS